MAGTGVSCVNCLKLTMSASSSSTDSPKRSARSHTACVQLSTPIFSSYVNACIWLVTRAWSTMVRASAVRPDMAQPMCRSISIIFSMDELSSRGDCTRFSTPSTVPCGVVMPTVVEPSWRQLRWNVKLTLMASMAYSTGGQLR